MRLNTRHAFRALSIFAIVTVIFYSFCLNYRHRKTIRRHQKIENLPIAADTITALDNRTFIIAPYYEPRLGRSVRVIAIVHVSVEELYCIFHCSTDEIVYVEAEIDLHQDRWGFPYGAADLLCEEPSRCDYTYMSFSESTNKSLNIQFEVRNRPPQPISANFTVCISTLYGNYNNVLQTIQSLEMYKILGASRVTIYNTSCSQDVDKVLRHYIDEGTLEVVPWPIDRHLRISNKWKYTPGLTTEIGYYGQTAALNDCLYRNMYKSKFVLLNDIDEIILPVKERNWSSLVESLQSKYWYTSVFRVEGHVFPTSAKVPGFDLWPHVPGVNILQHNLREPNDKTDFYSPKMIVNPRDVFQTSVHSALKHRRTWRKVAQNMAITFHCKPSSRKDIASEDLILDDTLRRHNASLVPNVDKLIQRLFPSPTMPKCRASTGILCGRDS